eukprot:scaffold285286_cov26-Tisochrysis_lutea.AAC.2
MEGVRRFASPPVLTGQGVNRPLPEKFEVGREDKSQSTCPLSELRPPRPVSPRGAPHLAIALIQRGNSRPIPAAHWRNGGNARSCGRSYRRRRAVGAERAAKVGVTTSADGRWRLANVVLGNFTGAYLRPFIVAKAAHTSTLAGGQPEQQKRIQRNCASTGTNVHIIIQRCAQGGRGSTQGRTIPCANLISQGEVVSRLGAAGPWQTNTARFEVARSRTKASPQSALVTTKVGAKHVSPSIRGAGPDLEEILHAIGLHVDEGVPVSRHPGRHLC